jgi:hypothetical protein
MHTHITIELQGVKPQSDAVSLKLSPRKQSLTSASQINRANQWHRTFHARYARAVSRRRRPHRSAGVVKLVAILACPSDVS